MQALLPLRSSEHFSAQETKCIDEGPRPWSSSRWTRLLVLLSSGIRSSIARRLLGETNPNFIITETPQGVPLKTPILKWSDRIEWNDPEFQMALEELSSREVIKVSETQNAMMVSNLLVILCGEGEAQPVINTGQMFTDY